MKSLKRIVSLVLTIFLFAGSFAINAQAAGGQLKLGIGFVTATSLRLREQPNTTSRTLAYAHNSEVVVLLEKVGQWYKVSYNLQEGYMHSDYLNVATTENVELGYGSITGNGVNVLAMGAFYVAPKMGCDIADAFLSAELGTDYEWWTNFYEFHKLAIDELEAFDYEEYKKNGFKVNKLGDYDLTLDFDKKPE